MVVAIVYSKKYNYAVQYSAKSGCSMLRAIFLNLHEEELTTKPSDMHHNIQHYFPLPKTIKWNIVPNFIVVRNPYTRVLSMFFNKYLAPSANQIKNKFDQHKIKCEQHTFHNFLIVLRQLKKMNKLNTIDVHLAEQVFHYKTNSLTQIVKLENIETELFSVYKNIVKDDNDFIEKVKRYYAEINELPMVLKTKILPEEIKFDKSLAYYDFPLGTEWAPPYHKFYDDLKLVNLVYEIYNEDFLQFGYSKDSYPKENNNSNKFIQPT